MEEVADHIFLIKEKGAFGAVKPTQNIYILAGKNGLIYDAGYGDKKTVSYLISQIQKIREQFKEKGEEFNLNRILPSHSHPDHFSGLKLLREKLNIKILLTKKMANSIADREKYLRSFDINEPQEHLKVKFSFGEKVMRKIMRFLYPRIYGLKFIKHPDEIIEENSYLEINGEQWQIFPSPGHAVDHISLYNEEKGILFSGDNILRTITTWLGPPNSDIEDYVDSIKHIQKLPHLKLVLSAHGSPITNPRERIKEILKHREEREKEVTELIEEQPEKGLTLSELLKLLYPGASSSFYQVARGWVVLTIQLLEKKGLIIRKKEKKEFRFFHINK